MRASEINRKIELVNPRRGRIVCNDAEPLLKASLADRAFVVINGNMLVKLQGMPLGVALKQQECIGGTLVPGKWYMPDIFHYVGGHVIQGFDQGNPRFDLPEATQWAEMRDVNLSVVSLEAIIEAARGLTPETIMQGGNEKRRRYRLNHLSLRH